MTKSTVGTRTVKKFMSFPAKYPKLVQNEVIPNYYSAGRCLLRPDEHKKYTKLSVSDDSAKNKYHCVFMDYVQDSNLEDYLDSEKSDRLKNSWSLRLGLARNIAAVVSDCHRQNLLVRELKLKNIMIDDKGRPTLLDQDAMVPIGYNWVTNPDKLPALAWKIRTPVYCKDMAPWKGESSEEERKKAASRLFTKEWDIYSFGIVLAAILDYPNISPQLKHHDDWHAASQEIKRLVTQNATLEGFSERNVRRNSFKTG